MRLLISASPSFRAAKQRQAPRQRVATREHPPQNKTGPRQLAKTDQRRNRRSKIHSTAQTHKHEVSGQFAFSCVRRPPARPQQTSSTQNFTHACAPHTRNQIGGRQKGCWMLLDDQQQQQWSDRITQQTQAHAQDILIKTLLQKDANGVQVNREEQHYRSQTNKQTNKHRAKYQASIRCVCVPLSLQLDKASS